MSGTPSNAMNLVATTPGIVNWDGTATMATTAITQYNVLVGGTGSNTIVSVAPSSTAGWVLMSNGASLNPTFQVLPYTPLSWVDIVAATSTTAISGYGYFVSASPVTITLPTIGSGSGNTIAFTFDGAGGTLTVEANAGQYIRIGKTESATGGTINNNFQGDSVTLVYRATDTTWIAQDVVGTWTVN
jgi:hypothetical protein